MRWWPMHFVFGSRSIFFSVLANYLNEQIQNLSFQLRIAFQSKLFSWHMVVPVFEQKSYVTIFPNFEVKILNNVVMNMDRALKF